MPFVHKLGEKPRDPVQAALWTFAKFSNWGMLHPLDEQRFQDFTGVAHVYGSKWQATDVESRLLQYRLSKDLAHKLGQRFAEHKATWKEVALANRNDGAA